MNSMHKSTYFYFRILLALENNRWSRKLLDEAEREVVELQVMEALMFHAYNWSVNAIDLIKCINKILTFSLLSSSF